MALLGTYVEHATARVEGGKYTATILLAPDGLYVVTGIYQFDSGNYYADQPITGLTDISRAQSAMRHLLAPQG